MELDVQKIVESINTAKEYSNKERYVTAQAQLELVIEQITAYKQYLADEFDRVTWEVHVRIYRQKIRDLPKWKREEWKYAMRELFNEL